MKFHIIPAILLMIVGCSNDPVSHKVIVVDPIVESDICIDNFIIGTNVDSLINKFGHPDYHVIGTYHEPDPDSTYHIVQYVGSGCEWIGHFDTNDELTSYEYRD